MQRKRTAGATSLLVSLMLNVVGSAPVHASLYPCTPGHYRTYDYLNHISAIGVTGQLQTPVSPLTGISYGPSAGDVVLLNYATGEFVQYGWYEGSATGLPFSSVPRAFFGESTSTGEILTAGPSLAPGSTHSFKLLRTITGGYHAYLDGTYSLSNTVSKGSIPTPEVVGETDVLCTAMLAIAHRDPSPPYPTLYFGTGTPTSLTWNVFIDSYVKSADAAASGACTSTDFSGQATFFGSGGG